MLDTTTTKSTADSSSDRRFAGRKEVRMRIVFDDHVNMNVAATLNISDGGLLVSSGVELPKGTPISIFPLDDELDAQLFELKGKVVRSFEDIMVSAYADDRFMMGIHLDLTDPQKDALSKYIADHVN
jgi:hypothetical protein